MRTSPLRLAIAAAALAGAPATAQFAGEHLVPAPDANFRLAWSAGVGGSGIQEWVVGRETVVSWTRMITVQRFGNRPGMTPMLVAQQWLGGLARTCGTAASPPVAVTVDGHAAVDVRYDCSRNPATGKPETIRARFVGGDTAIHIIQAATRRVPDAADRAWMEQVATAATLCAATSTDPRCATSVAPPLGSVL